MTKPALIALCAATFAASNAVVPTALAHAPAAIAAEFGSGNNGTDSLRLAIRRHWDRQWPAWRDWRVTGYWEANLGRWRGDGPGAVDLWDFGVTPVFRLSRDGGRLFLEGGIGAHYLSRPRINDRREFGSRFSFGDHIGVGWRFGDHGRHEIGYRIQHLSNGGIAEPNEGINFHQFWFSHLF